MHPDNAGQPERAIEFQQCDTCHSVAQEITQNLEEMYGHRDRINEEYDLHSQAHSRALDDLNTRIAMAEAASGAYNQIQPADPPPMNMIRKPL